MSISAIIDDPRFAIVFAALPSFASGFWVWWRYRLDRKDKADEAEATREMSREERRGRELDKQQETFSAEQVRWFGTLREENQQLRTELMDTRRDRERGWDLARYWHGTAHDVLRWGRNVRHNAVNMMQWIQAASRQHPDLGLPSVSVDPVPDRMEIPMGLEDPLANVLPSDRK